MCQSCCSLQSIVLGWVQSRPRSLCKVLNSKHGGIWNLKPSLAHMQLGRSHEATTSWWKMFGFLEPGINATSVNSANLERRQCNIAFTGKIRGTICWRWSNHHSTALFWTCQPLPLSTLPYNRREIFFTEDPVFHSLWRGYHRHHSMGYEHDALAVVPCCKLTL